MFLAIYLEKVEPIISCHLPEIRDLRKALFAPISFLSELCCLERTTIPPLSRFFMLPSLFIHVFLPFLVCLHNLYFLILTVFSVFPVLRPFFLPLPPCYAISYRVFSLSMCQRHPVICIDDGKCRRRGFASLKY